MPASSTMRFKSNFPQVYFRGTPNQWNASEMALVADNTWEISVAFGKTTDERFKFDVAGDWSHNYGGAGNDGIAEKSGADIVVTRGEYKITFNDETLRYDCQAWSGGSAIIEFEAIEPAEIEGLSVVCNGRQYPISNNKVMITNLAAGKHRVSLDALSEEKRLFFEKTFEVDEGRPAITKKYKVHTVDIPREYQRLFGHERLHRIEIQISRTEWNGMMADMTAHKEAFGNLKTGNYRKATFVYDGPAYGGQQVVLRDVGFRTTGNASRAYPQRDGKYQRVHWKINFDEYSKDAEFASLTSLILRHNRNDDSQVRELYVYDLLNRAGVRTCKTAPTRLYFKITESDGSACLVYYGVYTIIEPVDKRFLTKVFGKQDNDGNLYKCRKREEYRRGGASLGRISDPRMVGVNDWKTNYTPSYDLQTNTDRPDHGVLYDFIDQLNSLKDDQLHDFLENRVRVDAFLRFLAMQKLLGATDEYLTNSNNFMIYFDEDGRLTFIPLDYDNCLGEAWCPFDTARSGIYDMVFRDDPVLATKLLSFADYRRKYREYLRDFMHPENKLFVLSDYDRRFEQSRLLYADHLRNDTASAHEMKRSTRVRDHFQARTRSVLRQLGSSFEGYETG